MGGADSNLRLPPCEDGTLTAELAARTTFERLATSPIPSASKVASRTAHGKSDGTGHTRRGPERREIGSIGFCCVVEAVLMTFDGVHHLWRS